MARSGPVAATALLYELCVRVCVCVHVCVHVCVCMYVCFHLCFMYSSWRQVCMSGEGESENIYLVRLNLVSLLSPSLPL